MLKFLVLFLFSVSAVFALQSHKIFRVVNGQQVGKLSGKVVMNSGEFPYVVQIIINTVKVFDGTRHLVGNRCGGAIISMEVILTACHCVAKAKPRDIKVKAGMVNTAIPSSTMQERNVKEIIKHEKFRSQPSTTETNNDIALLLLDSKLLQTRYVEKIDLPNSPDYYQILAKATFAGFGKNEQGIRPEWLQQTQLRIIPNDICQMFTTYLISSFVICGLNQPNSTVCQGDSGGPLTYNGSVIGISSWTMNNFQLASGTTTCDPMYPAVFTKVLEYISWIKMQLNNSSLS